MRVLLSFLIFTLPLTAFEHFEARQSTPVAVTPDGTKLLALNSLESRLSVFSLDSNGTNLPLLIAEIPVGLEPVSVRPRNDNEVWVVNELSDTISIVDLALRQTVATIPVGDEPADLIFAQGQAFVSCARSEEILAIDPTLREVTNTIPLQGVFPRSLATNSDESRLYVAFQLSGNNTTVLHFREAPLQPAPTNPELPAAPRTALIVPDTDSRISYDVLDHDVAEIDVASGEVLSYIGELGTNIFDVLVAPDGDLWTAASEARNLIRYEPNLNGIFTESRVSRSNSEGTETIDLNPHATTPSTSAEEQSLALAQPMALLADGDSIWVAAFGSDRLATLSSNGEIQHRIDLRSLSNPDTMRGPRGLAQHPDSTRLYVLNKISDTLSIIDTETLSLVAEIPISSHNPMPDDQRRGRALFYDSRLSGNGTVSCGACHFDADHDGIAWDQGDPGGTLLELIGENLSIGESGPVIRQAHPMKGPMVTQSLRGIKDGAPFHWRGDKASILKFKPTFPNLQASAEPSDEAMAELVTYLEAVRNHPNPNRTLANELPAELAGGSPAQGLVHFNYLNTCSSCHGGPRGTNHIIDEFTSVLTTQPVKNATLEHFYKKLHFTPDAETSLSGFGFTHDGSASDIPRGHEYAQDQFDTHPEQRAHVTAYLLAISTDTAPAVGATRTLSPPLSDPTNFRETLESQAQVGNCGIVVWAQLDGRARSFSYDPQADSYQLDSSDSSGVSFGELLTQIDSSPVTITGVTVESTHRLSIDRDLDSIFNSNTPHPTLSLDGQHEVQLTPPILPSDWFLEESPDLSRWSPTTETSANHLRQFFRLRKTW